MTKKKELLAQIDGAVKTCRNCRLWRTSTQAVPGEGSSRAQIMFIGEGPGYHEDKIGRPFVGRAGKLLDRLLLRAGLSREEVFITNVVKHRPPENRAPMKDEARACLPYLLQQMKIIDPKVIVPLGRSALEIFIKDKSMGEVHGCAYEMGGRIIYPLYHPAAALRSPLVMKNLEKSFRKLPKVLRGELPVRELEIKNENKSQLKLI